MVSLVVVPWRTSESNTRKCTHTYILPLTYSHPPPTTHTHTHTHTITHTHTHMSLISIPASQSFAKCFTTHILAPQIRRHHGKTKFL